MGNGYREDHDLRPAHARYARGGRQYEQLTDDPHNDEVQNTHMITALLIIDIVFVSTLLYRLGMSS